MNNRKTFRYISMSLKRPLSPESNNDCITNDIRQLKRLKLHSIIHELQNEEANLVLLKKLRSSQQLSTRTNKNLTTIANGFHSAATRITTLPTKPAQPPITNPSPQPQQSIQTTTRKPSNSPLLTNSNKISLTHSYEEHKTQAKLALRKHLERDLLNIPLPKPSLQDIVFIPNGISLEFQPFLGLEDVVQCLNEVQNDRHRLPQRFTDHAHIDQPYACDQCGTDFTIRWWKHLTTKSSNEIINILCDRCKKQVTRRMSKSEHSTLLKNVFISAMDQEKEIEKHFNTLIKQQKLSSRSSKPLTTNTRQLQSVKNLPSTNNHQYQTAKTKNFATKLSQKPISTQKLNMFPQSTMPHGNHSRTVQHNKTSMPIHHQQQYRSLTSLPQQTKPNQIVKMPKSAMKQQTVMPSSHSIFPSNPDLINSFLSSNFGKPTNAKRRTFPNVEMK